MNQRTSDLLSDILEGMFQADSDGVEVISTEDLLSKVEDLNTQIREGSIEDTSLMIGSLDVEALYPSIDARKAGQIVRDRITESDLKVDGVDWRWVLIYLGLTMTPHDKVDQKLTGTLPRRICKAGKKPGKRPTILTANLDQHEERW